MIVRSLILFCFVNNTFIKQNPGQNQSFVTFGWLANTIICMVSNLGARTELFLSCTLFSLSVLSPSSQIFMSNTASL